MTLAEVVLAAAGSTDTPALRWMADALAHAERRRLTTEDIRRIDAYQGGAVDLHALLPAITPLARPRWYESEVTAQHGTAMTLGYLATPVPEGIAVGWACYAPAFGRLLGPVGPSIVSAAGMTRPADCTEAAWRELRTAVGITLRALLLDCGEPDA